MVQIVNSYGSLFFSYYFSVVDAVIDAAVITNYPTQNVHFVFERGEFLCQRTEVAVAVSVLEEIAAGLLHSLLYFSVVVVTTMVVVANQHIKKQEFLPAFSINTFLPYLLAFHVRVRIRIFLLSFLLQHFLLLKSWMLHFLHFEAHFWLL